VEPVSTILFKTGLTWGTQAALTGAKALGARWLQEQAGDQLRTVGVRLGLAAPANDASKRLAWVLYVELVTRISIAPLDDLEGLDREALSSLYTFFQRARTALVEAGPEAAAPVVDPTTGEPHASVGVLTVFLLNVVLRPFLARWHVALVDHEARRDPATASQAEHEAVWKLHDRFRRELAELQGNLAQTVRGLEEVLGVQPAGSLLLDAADG